MASLSAIRLCALGQRGSGARPGALGLATLVLLFGAGILRGGAQDACRFLARRMAAPWDLSARLIVTGRPAAGGAAAVCFDMAAADDSCELRFDGRRLRLLDAQAGTTVEVTAADVVLRRGEHALLVKRRVHGVRVLVDGLNVLEYPHGLPAGPARTGYRDAESGISFADVRLQPVGTVAFRDDFARQSGEPGPWTVCQGHWEIAAQSRPGFSSNPFCFRGAGQPAMAICGQWFWEDYRISAAVCLGDAADGAGLIVYADGAGHGILLRGTARELTLVLVSPGTERLLARHEGGLRVGQWHELALATRRGRVAAFVDTTPLFVVSTDRTENGQAGLWADSSAGVLFDDVQVQSCLQPQAVPFAARPAQIGEAFAADHYMHTWTAMADVPGGCPAIDDTMYQAPVGWRLTGGEWFLQSRWQCQPRWTWFGGHGRRLVAVWHKAQFAGDVTASAFAAFRMDAPFDPNYRHVGDFCMTICGDGQNLASGYTFAFAADRNRVSRLYRLGEVVAETPEGLLPDNRNSFPYREVHLPWLAVQLSRRGTRISAEVDGRELLHVEDAASLPGRQVALWSWDTDILLARVRITAAAVDPPPLPAPVPKGVPAGILRVGPDAALLTDGVAVPGLVGLDLARQPRLRFRYRMAAPAACNLYVDVAGRSHLVVFSAGAIRHDDIPLVASVTPAPIPDGRWHDAEADLGAIPAAYPELATLPIRRAWFGLECDDPYRLCGFGGELGMASVDIAKVRLAPSLRTDVASTRPDTMGVTVPATPLCETFETGLGKVTAALDDDGPQLAVDPWERAAGRRSLRVVNPVLGGSCDVSLTEAPFSPVRFPRLRFDYRVPDGLRVDLVLRVDSQWYTVKFTDADQTWPVLGSVPDVTADNQWHRADVDLAACLRAGGLDGLPITAMHLASGGYPGNEEGIVFRLDNLELVPASASAAPVADTRPPLVRGTTPAPDAGADGSQVAVRLADADSGLDWASARFTVNGREFRLGHPAVSYDPQAGTFAWQAVHAAAGGMVLGPDRPVTCTFTVSDLAGNALPSPYVWRWTAASATDRSPPGPPALSYVPGRALCRQTFEAAGDRWGDWGGCAVRRTDHAAATGAWALALTRSGHVARGQALWDIGRLPVDAFPLLGMNLWLPARGDDPSRAYSFDLAKLFFDGHADGARSIASLDAVKPGSWQFVQVDLRATRAAGDDDPFGILLRQQGDDGKPVGLQVLIDDVTVFSPTDREPGFAWGVPFDPSGIAGYSWAWDQLPETVPEPAVRTHGLAVHFADVPAGHWVFHVRAVDGAGNWGPPAHLAVRLE